MPTTRVWDFIASQSSNKDPHSSRISPAGPGTLMLLWGQSQIPSSSSSMLACPTQRFTCLFPKVEGKAPLPPLLSIPVVQLSLGFKMHLLLILFHSNENQQISQRPSPVLKWPIYISILPNCLFFFLLKKSSISQLCQQLMTTFIKHI